LIKNKKNKDSHLRYRKDKFKIKNEMRIYVFDLIQKGFWYDDIKDLTGINI